MQLLQSQGRPRADQAQQELPDQMDTDNSDHQNLLSKFGINTNDLAGTLGGLGKFL